MSKAQFIIGIDLGTTNCSLTYTKIGSVVGNETPLTQFPIPQQVDANREGKELHFPSFIYFPLEEEKQNGSPIVGMYAKERGSELPHRTIHSAKSWLCHDGIDRHDALLPILAEELEQKLSPVTACSLLLRHLKQAWDSEFPDSPFLEQQVYVTVPASFDPLARELINEAARIAGYPEVTLIEEPLAAFYAWLHKKGEKWRDELKVGDIVLVVDIGGGTTDFTIISVEEEDGNLTLERKAVGAHLLLGGDNIDLALAHIAKQKLESLGHEIDEWQLQSLVHSCRRVKEDLLLSSIEKKVDVTVLGRGSRLIGGMLSISLTTKDILQLIIEGFAPFVDLEEKAKKEMRSGIAQISLPFVRDPRITSQLSSFLALCNEGAVHPLFPSAVLFNGGSMKSALLRSQILEQIRRWGEKQSLSEIRELDDPDYDFGVSQGAVYYGLTKLGHGVRVRGGTNHCYFIGVESAAPAVPGMAPPLKALCIVPFGMEEGSSEELNEQQFSLVLGEEALFRFFSRSSPLLSNGTQPKVGTFVSNWKQELIELPAIHAKLEKLEGDGKTIRVKLVSKITELGVLELFCHAEDGRKWKLEFDTRPLA